MIYNKKCATTYKQFNKTLQSDIEIIFPNSYAHINTIKPYNNTIAPKGIYCIYNKINGFRYIGMSSRSVMERINNHISELENNKHRSEPLQFDYNKFGYESFNFLILEFYNHIDPKYLKEMEKYYIGLCKNLYNYIPFYN